MTKTKKVLSIILAILMIVTTIPFTPVASAAEAPALINDEAELTDALKNGGNYVLNDNITVTESLVTYPDVEITIDLNGFTIKASEILSNIPELWTQENVILTFKGGTLEQVMFCAFYSTVLFENMNIINQSTALYNIESDVSIKNTDIEAEKCLDRNANTGKYIIYSGTFTEDVSSHLYKNAVQSDLDGKYVVRCNNSYVVTIAYKVHSMYNCREYTGPDYDSSGMGFTIYYGNDGLNMDNYVVCDLSSSVEGEMLYVDVLVPEIPRVIEYYTNGQIIDTLDWSMYSVKFNDVTVWEGELGADGKGVDPYIARLHLDNYAYVEKLSKPLLGEFIVHHKIYSPWREHYEINSVNMLVDRDEYDYVIEDEPVYHKINYYALNHYGVIIDSSAVINCSKSVQGIEIIGDDISTHVDNKKIQIDFGAHDTFFNSFTVKISDAEWNEQRLLLYASNGSNIHTPEYCKLNLKTWRTFTLDAAGGAFASGEESSSTTEIKKLCSEKTGQIPVPERQGYTFNGYFLTEDTDHNDDVFPDSEKLTADTVINADKTWYASWSVNDYTVTYSYLVESGKRGYTECNYKYGEEYAALEIPAEVNVGDVKYTFSGWSPEFTGTKIMSDANIIYKAQYTTGPNYADYSKLDETVANAKELIQDEEYVACYTEEARLAFETLLEEDIERDLLASDQAVIDERINTINNTFATMEKNKHSVVFVDIDGEEILSVEVEYGSKVDVPVISSLKVCDESDHYVFSDWDKSTDGCEYVTRDMQFNAIYNKEAHSFTHYTVVSSSESTGRTLISYCDDGCGAKDILNIIGSCAEHEDKDNDGICDICSEEIEVITPDEPTEDTCDRCGEVHTNSFRNFICMLKDFFNRIINFFTGLFK